MKLERIDIRLPKQTKDFFEFASKLGGHKSLSDFFLFACRTTAATIIEKNKSKSAATRRKK